MSAFVQLAREIDEWVSDVGGYGVEFQMMSSRDK